MVIRVQFRRRDPEAVHIISTVAVGQRKERGVVIRVQLRRRDLEAVHIISIVTMGFLGEDEQVLVIVTKK